MATYVTLLKWTDKGVHDVKNSIERVHQARSMFESMGVTIVDIHWTQGKYDLIARIEAPDDPTLASALLRLAGGGNVRTETLRAFDEGEMSQIIGKIG